MIILTKGSRFVFKILIIFIITNNIENLVVIEKNILSDIIIVNFYDKLYLDLCWSFYKLQIYC